MLNKNKLAPNARTPSAMLRVLTSVNAFDRAYRIQELSYIPNPPSRPTAARCAVSHGGSFCASPSKKQNIKERNKINTEAHKTGARKNSFSGHAGDFCSVARKVNRTADKNRFDRWTQYKPQAWNCETRTLESPVCAMGVPKGLNDSYSKEVLQ